MTELEGKSAKGDAMSSMSEFLIGGVVGALAAALVAVLL
jgi:hypothetical protein